MKKSIVCLLAAVLLLLQLVCVPASAVDYYDHVTVGGKIVIAENSAAIGEATKNDEKFVKPTPTEFPKVAYMCTLDLSSVRAKFTEYFTNWATITGYTNPDPDLLAQLNVALGAMKLTGSFTIRITYPNELILPDSFAVGGSMIGFDDAAKRIFGNDTRTLTVGATESTLKIDLEVVGPEVGGTRRGFVYLDELNEHLDEYLCDLSLICTDVQTTKTGTFKVLGDFSGVTVAAGESTTVTIDYKLSSFATEYGLDSMEADCTIKELYKISFDVDGDTTLVEPIYGEEDTVVKLPIPHKEGYYFDGWYTNPEKTEKVTELPMSEPKALYGEFKPIVVADTLEHDDHFAYVIGYPEGDVRPMNNITREEVVTIFYRLMLDDTRDKMWTDQNDFADVDAGRWSNSAISTLANGGFIKGYPDGSFAPSGYITRAEFAVLASRFGEMNENAAHNFSDISGHWAEKYIADAVSKGWIVGYEDGTFAPEQYITRAEAMTLINRMLGRFVDEAGVAEGAIIWPDNPKTAWYYCAVEEATNSHAYDRAEGAVYEKWTALLPNRDWANMK